MSRTIQIYYVYNEQQISTAPSQTIAFSNNKIARPPGTYARAVHRVVV